MRYFIESTADILLQNNEKTFTIHNRPIWNGKDKTEESETTTDSHSYTQLPQTLYPNQPQTNPQYPYLAKQMLNLLHHNYPKTTPKYPFWTKQLFNLINQTTYPLFSNT